MRIGLVVDSACDLPGDYFAQHDIHILPITVRIGDAMLADQRDEKATLDFLQAQIAERGAEAETIPYSVQQIQDLFLQKLVIDYDYVFCMDGTSKDLISFVPTENSKHVLYPSGDSQGRDVVTVISPDTCYYPTGPDNDQTDPDQVTYTDQASAKTEGQASGTADDTSDSQNCALCPTGLDGAPSP